MAIIGITAPIFCSQEDKDLNLFIDNFLDYLNTIGIDLLDNAGVSSNQSKNDGKLEILYG
jgi:hypothetical protein